MITPDDKDWTWVLERRCPECGFDASGFERELVGSMILANAAAWQRVLRAARRRQRPRRRCGRRSSTRATCATCSASTTSGSSACSQRTTRSTRTGIRTRRPSTTTTREQDPATVAEELVIAAARLAAPFDAVHRRAVEPHRARAATARTSRSSRSRAYLIHDPIHHLWDVESPMHACADPRRRSSRAGAHLLGGVDPLFDDVVHDILRRADAVHLADDLADRRARELLRVRAA